MLDALTAWWETISLRTKVTGVTVFILTIGILIAGVGTTWLLRDYLVQRLDEQLQSAAEDFDTVLAPSIDPDAPVTSYQEPGGFYWAVLEPDGRLRSHNWSENRGPVEYQPVTDTITAERAAELEGDIFTLEAPAGLVNWRALALTGQFQGECEDCTVVISLNMARNEAVMTRYTTIFFGFGLLVIIVAAAFTRVLVTRTFVPLREVERTAAAIAAGDFSLRLRNDSPSTEVGRLNRALNTMLNRIDRAFTDRARALQQMRRFIGDASHELRTPLVTVRGYAELYRMGALRGEEDVAQAMERIEKEALRMGLLVEDLLQLARLDETRPLQQEPLDLIPLTRDAARDTMAQAPDRVVSVIEPKPASTAPSEAAAALPDSHPGFDPDDTRTRVLPVVPPSKPLGGLGTGPITLAGNALARLRRRRRGDDGSPATPASGIGAGASPAGVSAKDAAAGALATGENLLAMNAEQGEAEPVLIRGEENKIRQVLANLIGNALRFTPEGSPIELKVGRDDEAGTASISVIDHGEGVPTQIREQIFQRFWRADNSRARETGGSGLGLAIVSAIVNAHRGRVEVLETPGGGATFTVTLPMLQSAQATGELD